VDPGDTVAGRFQLEAVAGRGGMGTVFRARDLLGGDVVAVKVMRLVSAAEARRFEREAAVLADLVHAGIVRYVAHGVADDTPYLAMEWVEGETLAQHLARRRLGLAESLTILERAARVLAVAHRRGIVHRDIKPANLFLGAGDETHVKVVDFGIASRTQEARQLTVDGALVGTPGYMAPEQARGGRDVAPSADVFALGCVLYECLIGRPIFFADHLIALLARIILENPPRLRDAWPEAPMALDELVARMLAQDPTARPPDGAAVADELAAVRAELERGGELGAVLPVTPLPARIGSREQRILSIVLAGPVPVTGPHSDAVAETLVSGSPPPDGLVAGAPNEDTRIAHALRPFGARYERLVGGTIAVTLSGGGAATDQARLAAGAALALRAVMPDVRLALAVGRGVRAATAPMGEVIDRAVASLRKSRSASGVRLDEQTAGLLDARFEISGDGGGLYLVGERETEVVRTLLGRPTTCVGRDSDLTMLEAMFAECVSEPLARVALVTGPPGIGKSRLRYELVRRLRARGEAIELLLCRGDSVRAGSPFAMVAPALRRACGIAEAEPAEIKQRKLRARVGRHVPADQAARVSEFLGEVARVPFPSEGSEALRAARRDPALMGDLMREAWIRWLEAECGAQPVVVVLDDLHWGDLPTVQYMDAALRNLHDRSLLVVALARPEVHAQFPRLWAERHVNEIRLGPLTRKAAERLVREVLGDQATEEVSGRLVALADGNAFYLEELIRHVAGAPDRLPDTVLGMVQARLEALDDEARRCLRAGSVFGERFPLAGVAALMGVRGPELDALVDPLVAHELLVRPAAAQAGESDLVFRHALVREAAYAMLTEEDRALGHRLAGDWLEQQALGTAHAPGAGALDANRRVDAAGLAVHFDLGQAPSRAIPWYLCAAEQALEANDFAGALERAGRGLARGATGEILGRLRLVEAEAHAWRGEIARVDEIAEAAAAALLPGGIAWFRAVGELLVAAAQRGNLARARRWAGRAMRRRAEAGAESAQGICLARGALSLTFAGQYAAAAELGGKLDELAGVGSTLDRQARGWMRQVRALRAYFAGDPDGNLSELEAAHSEFEAAGDVRNACQTLGYLGFAYIEVGDYPRAADVLRQALAAAERMGLATIAGAALSNLGIALAHLGDLEEAHAVEEEALARAAQGGDARRQGSCSIYLAHIAVARGDPDAAVRHARAAVDLLADVPPSHAGALAALARALLAGGQTDEALSASRQAMALLDELGSMDEGESWVRLVWAEALAAAGDVVGAVDARRAACDRLRERAAKIRDPVRRESFLTRIPENARTLAVTAETPSREPGGVAPR
jgi:tetratricopeptide (TPR) repeat protein